MKGLELEPIVEDQPRVRFDLEVHAWEAGGEIGLSWLYNRDLFDRWRIEQMVRHYVRVLEAVIRMPDAPVHQLDILDDQDRRLLLKQFNATAHPVPEATLPELFEAQVRITPDAVAIVFAEESLTYRALNERADNLAHYLMRCGVGAEVLVAICMERSLEMMVAVLGVLKAGGSYVPLDLSYPKERLSLMVEDSGISVLLTQRRVVERLPLHKAVVIFADGDRQEEDDQTGEARSKNKKVAPDNLAYVIYTSGSTGRPKGVAMPHRPLVNLFLWQREVLRLAPEPRTLQFSPLSFDASANEAFTTWIMGGRLVMVAEDVRRDAAALVDFLIEEGVDTLFPPFVALQQIADECERRGEYPRQLRQVMSTAEPLQITESVRRFFKNLEFCQLHNEYGPSETHVVTAHSVRGEVEEWPALPPIGVPISNTQMYVLNDDFEAVPLGVPGELYISGANLARGYQDRPDLTAERFVPNPMSEDGGERMYWTGDLAVYLPDGTLRCLGRTDHQVKVRGYRIEPGEIEAALQELPEVAQAVVVVRENRPGEKLLVGYVVTAPGRSVDSSTVRQQLAQQLPDYMLPATIVTLDTFPLTPSGKLDRKALPQPVLTSTSAWRIPRNPKEEILRSLFAEVLGLERVGIDDNFFELGGHSLLATRLLSSVRSTLGVDISVRSLFETPTVAGLALRLCHPTDENAFEVMLPLRSQGNLPSLFCIHPANGLSWCYSRLLPYIDAGYSIYGLQARHLTEPDYLPQTIEEIAADYLGHIRKVQPAGPYYLIGWSFGGLVAYAIASLLQQQGDEVALLALLDSYPPVIEQGPVYVTRDQILPELFRELRYALRDDSIDAANLNELPSHISDYLGDLPLEALIETIQNGISVMNTFIPQRYEGDLIFFTATDSERIVGVRPEAWMPYISGEIEVHPIDCQHSYMLIWKEPAAQVGRVLAAKLNRIT
jgi:amino acid adenylation domain-containing protein